MPKGGARVRSGPAPDPNALRREGDSDDWLDLPAEGREGKPPEWPLSRQTKREKQLWSEVWSKPQALVWEVNGQELEVAMFVRAVRLGEQPSAPVSARTLVRQQMDSLGLTVPGLRSNRWRIVSDDGEFVEESEPAVSARDRFRVVTGEGA